MSLRTESRALDFEEALAHHDAGAAFVDMRGVDSYLEVHIPGSLSLLYEFGPGFAGRARDCLPLTLPLMLLASGNVDLVNASASLRGKGFEVLGSVEDGINQWAATRGSPASTETFDAASAAPEPILDVGDPGAKPPDGATTIPIERLWVRVHEIDDDNVTVASGYGVRAALAVGILERAGKDVAFLKTRPAR